MWWAYVESAAAEHDEGDGIVRVVEAAGHADGDLDPVVGRLGPSVGQLAGVLQDGVSDAAHALDGFLVPVEALRFDGYTDGSDLWQYVIANFGTLCWVPSCSAVSSWCPRHREGQILVVVATPEV